MAHGGDRYRNSINMDFSINLNPLGMHEKVKNRIIESIDQLSFYPDSKVQELGEKLRSFLNSEITVKEKLKPENIVFGNGASELITAVVNAVKPEKILLPVPSFSGYERAINNSGAEIVTFYLKDMVELTEELLDEITEEADILFLTNPNNPTGRYIDRKLLERILDKCLLKNVIVLLDECFMELSDEPKEHTVLGKINRWPNLLVLRAFTKSFAIPGVRLGYLVGADEKLLKSISCQLPEWNISSIAQRAGTACLEVAKEGVYFEEVRELIKVQREYMTQELEKLGFYVVSSDTCFMLIKHKNNNMDFYQELLEKKILIRDCSDYRNLEKGYYRIAIKLSKENERLLQVLREVIR